jgi:hypothetical protein
MSVEQAQHLLQAKQVVPRSLVHERYLDDLFSNVFCYLVGTVPMWSPSGYGSNFPSVWPLGLSLLLSVLMLVATMDHFPNLFYFFLGVAVLCYLQPFKVMNVVAFLSGAEFHSIGLKGKVDSHDTLALLGFTGIILMQPIQEKVTLMGFSLAIF